MYKTLAFAISLRLRLEDTAISKAAFLRALKERGQYDMGDCVPKRSVSIIDLLMGLFRGAVFDHGGVPGNCPLALMGRFPSLMGRFPECLNGPFSILKIHRKTAHEEKGH